MHYPGAAMQVSFKKEDRIIYLPDDIVKTIFDCLPIIDACRTSVLAKRWETRWTTIPNLDFNRKAIPSPLHSKLMEIAHKVILLHKGPLYRFSYDHLSCGNLPNMEEWLMFFSRKGIKELICNFRLFHFCKLPSTLFSCHQLVGLELSYVIIELPADYNGFENLIWLQLENAVIPEKEFTFLISKCPLLRKLVFSHFIGDVQLKINAPNLSELELYQSFIDLYLENTPLLSHLTIEMEIDEDDETSIPNNFITCLNGALKLESLRLSMDSIKFMTNGNAIASFPTYNCLKTLYLQYFDFQDEDAVLVLRNLLQSSPMLQEIYIVANTTAENLPSFCAGEKWLAIRFDHLKKLVVFDTAPIDMVFIQSVIANAPVLEFLDHN